MEQREWLNMLRITEKLSVEEMEMEIEDIETRVLELMEFDIQDEGGVRDGDEDEDGDQIMYQEEVQTRME